MEFSFHHIKEHKFGTVIEMNIKYLQKISTYRATKKVNRGTKTLLEYTVRAKKDRKETMWNTKENKNDSLCQILIEHDNIKLKYDHRW